MAEPQTTTCEQEQRRFSDQLGNVIKEGDYCVNTLTGDRTLSILYCTGRGEKPNELKFKDITGVGKVILDRNYCETNLCVINGVDRYLRIMEDKIQAVREHTIMQESVRR